MFLLVLIKWVLFAILLLVGGALSKILLIPYVRYKWNKHLYQNLPRHKVNCPVLEQLKEGGVERVNIDGILDENGRPYPLLDEGPHLDGSHLVGVTDPEAMKTILLDQELFAKHPLRQETIKTALGTGLVGASGEDWKRERRLLNPLFHHGPLKSMIPAMINQTNVLMKKLNEANGAYQDGVDVFSNTTLCVIIETMLGGDFDADYMQAQWQVILNNLRRYGAGLTVFGPLFNYFPIAVTRDYNTAMQNVMQRVQAAVTAKRNQKVKNATDLVGMMIEVSDEQGGITDERIIDECRTFLLAGHDTTATMLSWTMYFLGRHPDVQIKLHEEVDRVLGGEEVCEDKLSQLKYLKQTLEESLRMRPPAISLDRIATKDCTLLGQPIPKGTCLVLHLNGPSQNAYWENPQTFFPERFSEESKKEGDRSAFLWLPFSAGPRNCIGQKFALLEGQVILAKVLQSFKIETNPNDNIRMFNKGTVVPKGLHVKFIPRSDRLLHPSNSN